MNSPAVLELDEADNPVLLRKEDVSQLLNMGLTKINEFTSSGELRSIKIGRSRRYTRQAIVDFVAAMESEAGTS